MAMGWRRNEKQKRRRPAGALNPRKHGRSFELAYREFWAKRGSAKAGFSDDMMSFQGAAT